MKRLIENYVFNATERSIVFSDFSSMNLEHILVITNVTRNAIIYNFADIFAGGTITDGNKLMLDFDGIEMLDSDTLQIFVFKEYKVNESEIGLGETLTFDTGVNNTFGSQNLVEDGKIKSSISQKDIKESAVFGGSGQFVDIECSGFNTGIIQISSGLSGTVSFEASINGFEFQPIAVTNLSGAGAITFGLGFTAAAGIYRCSIAGVSRLRARVSAYTSGQALVTLVASYASIVAPVNMSTTGQLYTVDSVLPSTLRPGFQSAPELPIMPIINWTPPTGYIDNKYSRMPQILPRMRVESGGDKKLPFAQQQDTNKMLTSDIEVLQLLEKILLSVSILTDSFIKHFEVEPPTDYRETR